MGGCQSSSKESAEYLKGSRVHIRYDTQEHSIKVKRLTSVHSPCFILYPPSGRAEKAVKSSSTIEQRSLNPQGPLVQTDRGTYPVPTAYCLRYVPMYEAEVKEKAEDDRSKSINQCGIVFDSVRSVFHHLARERTSFRSKPSRMDLILLLRVLLIDQRRRDVERESKACASIHMAG